MINLLESKQKALKEFFQLLNNLRDEGILINKKDFTCQIGEWIIETIYNGKRATSGIQKDWDIDINGKRIQVKAHAKAEGNNNRWSAVNNKITERVDELIIIVFTFDYKLKEFYKIPWDEAIKHIRRRGKQKPRPEINWSHLEDYKQNLNSLPRQDIIQLFK
jgi:sugar-specific transcriptional regulator TrmB